MRLDPGESICQVCDNAYAQPDNYTECRRCAREAKEDEEAA